MYIPIKLFRALKIGKPAIKSLNFGCAMKSDIKNKQKVYNYPQINLAKGERLTQEQILDLLEDNVFVEKYKLNQNYYIGANTLPPATNDIEAPNNQVTVPYARTLTNTVKGYMYKPGLIKYTYDGSDDAYFEQLKQIFDTNNEPQTNSELGEHQSKYGIGIELLYLKDNEGKIMPYFTFIDPKEVILIYDYSIEKNLICAIRYYTIDTIEKNVTKQKLEIYYPEVIEYYTLINSGTNKELVFENTVPNFFFEVPFIIYKNNEEYHSDYEPVATMIDLYDKLMSDSANEMDRFAAAYMVFKNYVLGGNEEENRKKMATLKKMRAFFVNGDGEIEFLTKNIPTEFIQEIKTTLRDDIVYHTQIPDFRDESFGTASGIAIKYKLINFENLCATKESFFKDGLYQRIKLINNFFKIQADTIELKEVEIDFDRNIPMNVMEEADIAVKLQNIVSQETLLDQLSIVDDVESEMERIKKEDEEKQKQFDIDNMFNEPDQQVSQNEVNDEV